MKKLEQSGVNISAGKAPLAVSSAPIVSAEPPCPLCTSSIVAAGALGGGGERKKRRRKKITSARKTCLCSFHLFLCTPLQGSLHRTEHFQRHLDNLEVHVVPSAAEKKKKGEGGGLDSFYSIFILLGSGSLLLSCSSPSPCRLTSIPPFLSSPLPLPLPLLPCFLSRALLCQVV